MRGRGSFDSYRGRRTGNDVLKQIILVLIIVIAVLAGIFLLGREDLFQLFPPEETTPGTVQETSPPAEGTLPTVPSEEVEQPEHGEEEVEQTPQAKPEPEPEPAVMTAVELSAEDALSILGSQLVQQAGGNSLILNMKPANGPLGWVSGQPMAQAAGVNSKTDSINEKLKLLNQEELYTIARVSCFRDELLSVNKAYCVRTYSDYRWQDYWGINWTSPGVLEVQDYLIGLCIELAELGFDEILLDCCGYPLDGIGEMTWIKPGSTYDPENFHVVIDEFLTRLHQALESYEVTLSIRTNAQILTQNGAMTGLTAEVLEKHADRIWMESQADGAPTARELLEQAQITQAQERLVEEVTVLAEESETAQALYLEGT